jgi:MSHA biogenesis protein MshJ
MNLKMQWQTIKEKIEPLSFRERIMVCCAVLTFIYLFWNGILFGNVFSKEEAIQKKNENTKHTISSLQAKIKEMDALINLNTVTQLKENIIILKSKNTAIEEEIMNIAGALVGPKEMIQVLKDLVEKIQGLTIVRIENKGATPMFKVKTTNEKKGTALELAPQIQIYTHSLAIELKGNYFNTLSFIEMVEKHNLQIWWDELSYKVTKHPDANIKILLHTLSLEESFIGA